MEYDNEEQEIVPNAVTLAALDEPEDMRRSFATVADLMADLLAD